MDEFDVNYTPIVFNPPAFDNVQIPEADEFIQEFQEDQKPLRYYICSGIGFCIGWLLVSAIFNKVNN